MSHIIIHRVEDIAKRHLARILQLEAMPPQMQRGDFNTWDFNRVGAAHGFEPSRRRRGRAIEEQYEGGGAVMFEGPGEEILPSMGEASCPLTRSFSLWCGAAALPAGSMIATSSRPIPFPYTIEDVVIRQGFLSTLQIASWNLVVGYTEHSNSPLTEMPSGPVLWDQEGGLYGAFPNQKFIGPRFLGSAPWSPESASKAGPFEAGTRVILVLYPDSTAASSVDTDATITVRECAPARRRVSTVGGVAPPPPPGGGELPPPPIEQPTWEEIF